MVAKVQLLGKDLLVIRILLTQLQKNALNLGNSRVQGSDCILRQLRRLWQFIPSVQRLVLQPADIQAVVFLLPDPFSAEAAPATGLAGIGTLGLTLGVVAVGLDEVGKVFLGQRGVLLIFSKNSTLVFTPWA